MTDATPEQLTLTDDLRDQYDAELIAWLQEQYETSEGLPVNARHMISIIRRCIRDKDHRRALRNQEHLKND